MHNFHKTFNGNGHFMKKKHATKVHRDPKKLGF